MEKPEEFHDELASLSLVDEPRHSKPLHRNPKFWIPVGIIFIAAAVGIGVMASGGSSDNTSSSILPGLSDGGSSDGDFGSTPVSSPTTAPRTNPQTMPPTTSPPTASPVATVVYNPPSTGECQQIAVGDNLPGQASMVLKSFAVPIDVVMTDNSNIVEATIVRQLQNKIQTKIVPALAGCSTRRRLRNELTASEDHRQLQAAPYIVANAHSEVQEQLVGCKMSNALNCMHVVVNLNLFLKGDENANALMKLISDTFAPPGGIVNKLELEEPIVGLWINSVEVSVTIVPTAPAPAPGSPTPAPGSVSFEGIAYDEDDDVYDDLYPDDDDVLGDDDDDLLGDDDDDLLGDDDDELGDDDDDLADDDDDDGTA